MNETQLQQLFHRYQQKDGTQEKDDCVKDLSVMVYGYSKKHFIWDSDETSDFFLYVYPKLENLLSSYDSSRGLSISSYLSFRLMLLFRTYLARQRAKKNYISFCSDEVIQMSGTSPSLVVLNAGESLLKKQLGQNMNLLKNPTRIILRLHYGLSLTLDDIRFFKKNKTLSNFIERYRLMRHDFLLREQRNRNTYRRYMEKLANANILSQTHPKKKDFYHRRYRRLLKNPPRLLSVVKMHEISYLLEVSLSTVQRRIKDSKKKIFLELRHSVRGKEEITMPQKFSSPKFPSRSA